jgi:glucosamine--fructose-6-phosphate aminotransferase (isomerizing)
MDLQSNQEPMINQTHLYREIFEQPQVIQNILDREKQTIQDLAEAIKRREITHIVIAARGTSDNAGRYAQYVLGALNGLTVALAAPSLYTIYKKPPTLRNALVLGISQSGESPDIVAVLDEARRQGTLTAAITNSPDSDLAQEADIKIDLHAGIEKAVAATKTYTSELAAIALLSASLAQDAQMKADLDQIPQSVSKTLEMQQEIAQVAPRYRYMERSVVIGRGYNYSTAFELALKIKELTYTIVEPYSSADFLHGPLAMIERGFPVIIIAPTGVILKELRTFIQTISSRHAEVIAISDDKEVLKHARIPLSLPASVPEWLSPMTTIIPGQMFAMHLAHARDYDVDSPRGLHKVTKTE